MLEVKEFITYNTEDGKIHTPTDDELREAKNIATSQNCIVHLNWHKAYSGWYDRYIYPNTNIEDTIKDVRSIVYGM